MAADGELPERDAARVQHHLAACWECRARKQEIETTIGEFIHFQRGMFDYQVPPVEGPRALLKAQMAQVGATQPEPWFRWVSPRLSWAALAVTCLLAAAGYWTFRGLSQQYAARLVAVSVPNPALTPGAIVLLSRQEVCRQTSANNRAVSAALQRRVFDEYGMRAIEPRAYEVDYLITPALGGADDIHNLWPQSSSATVWNAQAKDALEDHLRNLVCQGDLDLATAQHEIATNWIEAYKKYFHTDRPLAGLRN